MMHRSYNIELFECVGVCEDLTTHAEEIAVTLLQSWAGRSGFLVRITFNARGERATISLGGIQRV